MNLLKSLGIAVAFFALFPTTEIMHQSTSCGLWTAPRQCHLPATVEESTPVGAYRDPHSVRHDALQTWYRVRFGVPLRGITMDIAVTNFAWQMRFEPVFWENLVLSVGGWALLSALFTPIRKARMRSVRSKSESEYPFRQTKGTDLFSRFTREEAGRILRACENPKHRMLLELCYGCGLRVSELVSVRESLYKALSGERAPSFDTILRVVGALGLKLHAEPAHIANHAQQGAPTDARTSRG